MAGDVANVLLVVSDDDDRRVAKDEDEPVTVPDSGPEFC